jgi:hypothetical protein
MNQQEGLHTLHHRFLTHMHRHPGLTWDDVENTLNDPAVWTIVSQMEASGGEPDIVVLNNQWYVVDMVLESPKGRRSCCYDEPARLARKKFPPQTSAQALASSMNAMVIDEVMYQELQRIEPLDTKTSSWLLTPEPLRQQGGALFGDRRFDRVFLYANGADSYYADRGVRTYITLPKGNK